MASGPCLHGCGEDDLVDGVCAEEEGRVEEVLPQRRLLRPTELAVAAGAAVKARGLQSVQSWPKKFVLGFVIPILTVGASSRNLGQTFFAISVFGCVLLIRIRGIFRCVEPPCSLIFKNFRN